MITQQYVDDYYKTIAMKNMPNCKNCLHSWDSHLIPYTFNLRKYKASTNKTHEIDACGWSAGAWDAGCSCKGYK